jgi:cell division transport system permease protein
MSLLFVSEAERRLIPASGVRGPVPLLIAIMTFVMVVVAAAGLALSNTASVVKAGVENRYSIQIADGSVKAPTAISAARAAPGVSRVEQVPPEDLRRTLERWLGPEGAKADLPLPVIIDVDLRPGADPSAVSGRIERDVPGARFVAHRTSLAPLLDALRGLTLLAFGLVLLIALASAAAIVLAARGALDTHRATIEVMHGIGATDDQVAPAGRHRGRRRRRAHPRRDRRWSQLRHQLGRRSADRMGRCRCSRPDAAGRCPARNAGCQGSARQGIARAAMIARLLSFAAIFYVLGFALFAVTLGAPAPDDAAKVDAIVVITGGKGRIEHAARLLAEGKGKRLLIAGADPSVRKADLVHRLGVRRPLFDCCVDLGSESVDTRSNAEEAKRWVDRRKFRSLRLVTSDWHMRRARYEFNRQFDPTIRIIPDAVKTEPSFMTLFAEYNKYLLRRLSVWLDI